MSKSNNQPTESQPSVSAGPSLDIYAVALALLLRCWCASI